MTDKSRHYKPPSKGSYRPWHSTSPKTIFSKPQQTNLVDPLKVMYAVQQIIDDNSGIRWSMEGATKDFRFLTLTKLGRAAKILRRQAMEILHPRPLSLFRVYYLKLLQNFPKAAWFRLGLKNDICIAQNLNSHTTDWLCRQTTSLRWSSTPLLNSDRGNF